MLVTLFGIAMDIMVVQPQKAPYLMRVTLSGIVTDIREAQP
jgi:hypothetical protein